MSHKKGKESYLLGRDKRETSWHGKGIDRHQSEKKRGKIKKKKAGSFRDKSRQMEITTATYIQETLEGNRLGIKGDE